MLCVPRQLIRTSGGSLAPSLFASADKDDQDQHTHNVIGMLDIDLFWGQTDKNIDLFCVLCTVLRVNARADTPPMFRDTRAGCISWTRLARHEPLVAQSVFVNTNKGQDTCHDWTWKKRASKNDISYELRERNSISDMKSPVTLSKR